MSASASTILMPDTEPAWKLWKSLASGKSEALESPAHYRDSARPLVVGLPATACRSVGLILPSADPALLPAMVQSQLERRGIVVKTEPAPNFAWHQLGQDTANTVVSVDVLADPFPEIMSMPRAANYTAALRLLSLPPRDLVLVEEQGNLVLAASHQGRLWHSHVLGTAEMSVPDLARELDIAKMSLESLDGLGVLRGVTLVGDRLAPLIRQLKQYTTIPLESVAALEPARNTKLDDFPKLLPPAVFEAQAARSRSSRLVRIAMLVALLYVVLFAGAFWYLSLLQHKANALRDEIAKTDGPATEIRKTAQRWHAFEPAIDAQRYPVVQLSQITAIMPPSGVLIKQFETKVNEITITGDARDAQTATQFVEDLKKNAKLGSFTWTMPVPSVKDKVASFKIQGKLEGS